MCFKEQVKETTNSIASLYFVVQIQLPLTLELELTKRTRRVLVDYKKSLIRLESVLLQACLCLNNLLSYEGFERCLVGTKLNNLFFLTPTLLVYEYNFNVSKQVPFSLELKFNILPSILSLIRFYDSSKRRKYDKKKCSNIYKRDTMF